MKKAPDAFRTISEVSEILDTPAHVLRFWESKFHQVRPVKRAGGRRYYRPDDLALIAGIKHLLQDRGMTIRGVQKIMQEEGVRHVVGLGRSSGRIALEAEPDTAPDAIAQDATEATAVEPPLPTAAAPQPGPAAGPLTPPPAPPAAQTEAAAPEAPAPTTDPAPTTAPAQAEASPAVRRAPPPRPEFDDDLPDPGPRLAQQLRGFNGQAPAAFAPLAQRLDRLLDRMAEASGTRRW
jgi:DNA-binding transcriptional MerR regulator